MQVIGFDVKPCVESTVKFASKREVLERADYVTIHTGGKEVIVGDAELRLMKPSAFLINTSRGANVDEEALYNALKEKRIAGAALDVYVDEPKTEGAEFRTKLKELDNVVFSSHLGASTVEAQRETSIEIARVVSGYLKGGDFTNSVNAGESIELEERPFYTLFIYHRDVPGVFASIDKVLADNEINIRANFSRQIGKGGFAISVYMIHKEVTPDIIKTLRGIENICDAKI
jgi:D-3-phosphoglycerate dehydrogenase